MSLKKGLRLFFIGATVMGALFTIGFYIIWVRSVGPVQAVVETPDGTFKLGAPLPEPRTEAGGVAIGNYIYVLGGITSFAQTYQDFYRYDASTDKWEKLPDLPMPVNHPGVVTDGKDLYLVGGFAPLGIRLRGFMFAKWIPYSTLYKFDTALKTWSQLLDMPEPRGGGGYAYGNGKIWYVGGIDSSRALSNALFSYSVVEGNWEICQPMKVARDHLQMVYLKGSLYAISGRKDDLRFNLDNVEKYDLETQQWSDMAPIPTPRGGFASLVYKDEIYTFGGENVWSCYDKIEVYNADSNRWRTLAPLPEGRHGIIPGLINGEIHLVSGGKHPRISISSLHRIFTPNN